MSNRFVKTIHSNRSYCKLIPERVFNRTWCSVAAGIGTLQESPTTKRFLPNKQVYTNIPRPQYIATKKQREEFRETFPSIANDLIESYENTPEIQKVYSKILYNNVPIHKQCFGPLVLTTYEAFASHDDYTLENIRLSYILAWCVELLHSSWKMTDDIMDRSETRCALPCWYKNEDVGMRSVIDADFLERCSYDLLKRYFSKQDIYVGLTDLCHEMTNHTLRGQMLDMACLVKGGIDLNVCNMEKSNLINFYKGTLPALIFPIELALHLAKWTDAVIHEHVRSILIDLGDYANAQNHVIDCYGDPLITGKVGSDIQNGKMTWFIIRAFEKATQSQKQILKRNYGSYDKESVLEIKEIYEKLNLFEEYMQYENETYCNITKRIEATPEHFPKKYFIKLVGAFFGRDGYIPVPYQSPLN